MEDGGTGEVLGFAGVRTAPFQSGSRRREDAMARRGGLAQSSKTLRRADAMARRAWRRFGRAAYGLDDNTGFWQFLGVVWRGGQWEL